jgi:hypothetical protein
MGPSGACYRRNKDVFRRRRCVHTLRDMAKRVWSEGSGTSALHACGEPSPQASPRRPLQVTRAVSRDCVCASRLASLPAFQRVYVSGGQSVRSRAYLRKPTSQGAFNVAARAARSVPAAGARTAGARVPWRPPSPSTPAAGRRRLAPTLRRDGRPSVDARVRPTTRSRRGLSMLLLRLPGAVPNPHAPVRRSRSKAAVRTYPPSHGGALYALAGAGSSRAARAASVSTSSSAAAAHPGGHALPSLVDGMGTSRTLSLPFKP